MSLERPPSVLPGVRYGAVARATDTRGAFRELWRADAFAIEPGDAGADPSTAPTFVQANLSTSAPGVLRGLHYHRRQLDYWVVASGRALVALVDLRPLLGGSDRPPVVETRELGEDDWVVIPAGVAHGFLALEALGMLYLVTNGLRRQRRARLRLGRPDRGRSLARHRRDRRRPADRLRARPQRAGAGRPGGALAPRGTMTGRTPTAPPPHRTARDRTGPPRWAYEVAGPSRD